MKAKDTETFYPTTRQEWRLWLEEHHNKKQSIWLIQCNKKSGLPTITWSEAVDEALCFGWIDSIRKTLDQDRFIQFFTRRKPKSVWSKINKEKVEQLIEQGLMKQAGLCSIETAKQNGSWTILDDVEELRIPEDLEKEFQIRTGSKAYFLSLSRSVRKSILQWLVLARKAEIRQKRILEIAELAAQARKPKQFG